MDIQHISVSRKQTWDTCQQQYKYRYHLKIVSEKETPEYFDYGKIVHKAAELYVQDKGKTPIEEITNSILSGQIIIEEGYGKKTNVNLSQDYLLKLPSHLKNIKYISDKIGYDGHLEWPFKFDIDPPTNKLLVGFIDRLVIRGDKYFILDYKTTKKGKWRKTPANIKNDLQLRCYGRIVQKTFGAKAENISAALYYLDGANLISTKFTDKLLLTAEQELLDAYKSIVSTKPEMATAKTGFHCRNCDYNNICPYYANM
jgi:ATP-dependent exoDNAse (exonuclease V) beta subunit